MPTPAEKGGSGSTTLIGRLKELTIFFPHFIYRESVTTFLHENATLLNSLLLLSLLNFLFKVTGTGTSMVPILFLFV